MIKPQPIRVLDPTTASRIAAGEVVDRPASVVKELVENSLDAGAHTIRIEVASGGKKLIRVADDGCGIPPHQVAVAFARHATSKLATAADLDKVATLGFRGEALAAIAAVARVTILTRPGDSATGARLRVDAGDIHDVEPAGAPPGTVLTVEDLFRKLPARQKFLASDAAEARRVTEIVGRYALAHPECAFTLVRGGRRSFASPGTGDLKDAAAAVFGRDVADELLPVASPHGPIAVDGLTSPPHLHRATRKHIALFVNRRWIRDQALAFAVVQAYHTFLPKGRFPLAVILIQIPAGEVDVNVHPAKTEVRFRDPRAVFAAAQAAVRRTVVGGAPVAPLGEGLGPGAAPWAGQGRPPDRGVPRPGARGRRPPGGQWTGAADATIAEGSGGGPYGDTEGRIPPLRPLGQVAATYIVAEGPDGIYIVDQHAAHERVLFDRLVARAEDPPVQGLLEPLAVETAPAGMAAFEAHAQDLVAAGFDLEAFGPTTLLLRAVPDVLVGGDPAAALVEVLDDLAEGASPVARAVDRRIAAVVCKRGSVKAGQSLSTEEMRALLRDLEATAAPRTCPHGRSTVIALSRQ
ncbi:MAG: DNA mismatch repair endonuclease MutL, partial [Anaerolineae bacterium]